MGLSIERAMYFLKTLFGIAKMIACLYIFEYY